MDPDRYAKTPFGHARQTIGPHGYVAFFPNPIPRELTISRDNLLRIADSEAALGRLAGTGRLLPDPHLLDTKRRPEGWRVRHRTGPNWVKIYDKASVLRAETVINNPREFKILRYVTDADGQRSRRWCPMRKGVSDLWRCYQIGIAANQRYLRALSAAPMKGEGVTALDALCRPHTRRGRRVARFSPLNPADLALFKAAMVGQHNIVGFRNADLAAHLYRRPPADPAEAHRRCERVSRSSSSSEATASSPRSPAPGSTASPPTANA